MRFVLRYIRKELGIEEYKINLCTINFAYSIITSLTSYYREQHAKYMAITRSKK
jgi:hypothetical protein